MGVGKSSEQVFKYFDRHAGKMRIEKISYPKVQYWIARSKFVRAILAALLNRRWYCRLYGKWMDRAASKKNIQKFIDHFDIDLTDVEKSVDQYPNLNAFFARKLKPESRPFAEDASVFCSPADGKILVYPQLDERVQLPIKHSHVTITDLLSSEGEARPFYGGSACIIRLAPYDYHRFHFPTDGQASPPKEIDGRYYLVNQLALSFKPDLFAHNKRTVTCIETEGFGRFAYVEVAGFAVGRIVQTHMPGDVQRGQEKGYFQFGGSTLVLLFEPEKIIFDQDLVLHTQSDIEVQVLTGMQIGVRRL